MTSTPRNTRGLQPTKRKLRLFTRITSISIRAIFATMMVHTPSNFARNIVNRSITPVLNRLTRRDRFNNNRKRNKAIQGLSRHVIRLSSAIPRYRLLQDTPHRLNTMSPLRGILCPRRGLLRRRKFNRVVIYTGTRPRRPIYVNVPYKRRRHQSVHSNPRYPRRQGPVTIQRISIRRRRIKQYSIRNDPHDNANNYNTSIIVPNPTRLFTRRTRRIQIIIRRGGFDVVSKDRDIHIPLYIFSSLCRG